jgi:hypothetical protein
MMAGISGIWVLVVAILAAGAAFFHYWSRRRQTMWWLPMGARFLAYVLVGLLLLNPISEGLKSERRKPRVWVVSDGSSSLRDDTAVMNSWMRDFRDQWASKAELRFGNLSGSLSFDPAQTQDLSRTRLDALSEALAMQPMAVDAVIVLSDGQWNSGVNPRYAAWPTETKLYTVPFGLADEAPQFELEHWFMNAEVKVNEAFRSEWAFQLYGDFPSTAALVVLHKGKVLGKMPLGQRKAGTLNMDFKLSELGNQVLETQVIDAYGKLWYRDQKSIRVIESGKKVLVLYNELHPDVGAITRSLKASNGHTVITQPVREPFPVEVDLIVQFGLTVNQLDRLPADIPIWHFPEPDQASALLSHRTKREWAQSGVWQGAGYWTQESDSYLEGLQDYPPLQMPVLKPGPLPESSIHAKQFALGNQTGFPLCVFLGTAGLEESWFLGRGIWRWRAACYRRNQSFDAFDRWVLSISQRLMAGAGARNALQLRTIPEKPRESEAFSVRLWKTGPDGQTSGEGEFALRLEKSSGLGEWSLVQESNLSRNADVWQSAFQGLDTGDYRLVANWEKGSSKLERSLAWKVVLPPLEPQLGADTSLLKQWALDHQGAMLSPRYAGGVELPESRLEEEWTQWPWREQGLVMLFIGFLLGLEWFLRKWLGHI